jgi:hypothetical protein
VAGLVGGLGLVIFDTGLAAGPMSLVATAPGQARREGRTAPMRPGDAAAQAAVPGSGQLRRQGLPPTGHRNARSRAAVDTVGEDPQKETR